MWHCEQCGIAARRLVAGPQRGDVFSFGCAASYANAQTYFQKMIKFLQTIKNALSLKFITEPEETEPNRTWEEKVLERKLKTN